MFPPALRIGGSQLNALELAEEMQGRGHDVVIFSEDGPLRSRVEADSVALHVEDEGVGFSAKDALAIFEPYQRGEGVQLRHGTG